MLNCAQAVSYTLHTIGDSRHKSWCQQNTNDVMRIARQMIRQLNSLAIYRQLSNCPQSQTVSLCTILKHGRNENHHVDGACGRVLR